MSPMLPMKNLMLKCYQKWKQISFLKKYPSKALPSEKYEL